MCCIGDETACTILSRCNSIKMIRRFDFVNKKVKNIANTLRDRVGTYSDE